MSIYVKSNTRKTRATSKAGPVFTYDPAADGEMDKLQKLAQDTHGKGWAKCSIKEQLALVALRSVQAQAEHRAAGNSSETQAQLFSARLSHRIEANEKERSCNLQFVFEADTDEADGLKKSLVSLPARYVLALASDEGLAMLQDAAKVIQGYGFNAGQYRVNPELVRSTWNPEGGEVLKRGPRAGEPSGVNELADDAAIKAWLSAYTPKNA